MLTIEPIGERSKSRIAIKVTDGDQSAVIFCKNGDRVSREGFDETFKVFRAGPAGVSLRDVQKCMWWPEYGKTWRCSTVERRFKSALKEAAKKS